MLTVAVSKETETFRREFNELYRENYQMVYQTAYRITKNREDAKDVLQNVFKKLIEAEPPSDFFKNRKGYLYRTARNQALNFRRDREIRNGTEEDVNEIEIPDLIPGEDHRFAERLSAAISELDPDTANLLSLRYDHGYSCREIARIVGKTRASVAMTLMRVHRRIKQQMSRGEKQ